MKIIFRIKTPNMDFKKLNTTHLKQICKDYNIPINGVRNRKELLHQIFILKQIFKPKLPKEIYSEILLHIQHNDLLACKIVCKKFNEIINDDFWNKKLLLDFGVVNSVLKYTPLHVALYETKMDDEIKDIRIKYVKISTERGKILIGSENFISILDCKEHVRNNKRLMKYFNRCKDVWNYLNEINSSDESLDRPNF